MVGETPPSPEAPRWGVSNYRREFVVAIQVDSLRLQEAIKEAIGFGANVREDSEPGAVLEALDFVGREDVADYWQPQVFKGYDEEDVVSNVVDPFLEGDVITVKSFQGRVEMEVLRTTMRNSFGEIRHIIGRAVDGTEYSVSFEDTPKEGVGGVYKAHSIGVKHGTGPDSLRFNKPSNLSEVPYNEEMADDYDTLTPTEERVEQDEEDTPSEYDDLIKSILANL